MAAVTPVAETPVDPLRQYRSWASVLFALLGAVALIAGALVIPATSAPLSVVLLATVGLSAAVLFGVSLAVDRGVAWAIHAIGPLCALLIAAGLLRAAVALSHSEITVPLEVLGAIAVVSRPHPPAAMPPLTETGRRRMWLVVAALVISQLLPYVGQQTVIAGLLGANEDDLGLTVELDCAGSTGPDAPVTARVAWSWAGGALFAPPTDGLVVEWYATSGEDPGVGLAVVGTRVSDDSTINMGSDEAPDVLLEPFRRGGGGFIDFLITRSGSEFQDGWVEVDLGPTDPAIDPRAFELHAAYAHGDRWMQRSQFATCA
jgi:hypothetical protein